MRFCRVRFAGTRVYIVVDVDTNREIVAIITLYHNALFDAIDCFLIPAGQWTAAND